MREAATNRRIREEPAASAVAELSRRGASGASSAYLPRPETNDWAQGPRTTVTCSPRGRSLTKFSRSSTRSVARTAVSVRSISRTTVALTSLS